MSFASRMSSFSLNIGGSLLGDVVALVWKNEKCYTVLVKKCEKNELKAILSV